MLFDALIPSLEEVGVQVGGVRRGLAQHPTDRVRAAAARAASATGLPLEMVDVGERLMEQALGKLLEAA